MSYPKPTPLFHITSIRNLENILNAGALIAKNILVRERIDHCDIAYADLQDRRSRVIVPLGAGGCLHDYVPFYFAPRSPMLDAIRRGLVAGCNEPQENILHFVVEAESIATANVPFVFTNGHAIMQPIQFFNSLSDIDKVDWEIILEPPTIGGYAKYWQDNPFGSNPKWSDRKRRRQAEFLVYQRLSWQLINGICTMTESQADQIRQILRRFNLNTPVYVEPKWYY
ncbi:MAG: DUF4433 domain-containing protein [Rickettsiales bacterium]